MARRRRRDPDGTEETPLSKTGGGETRVRFLPHPLLVMPGAPNSVLDPSSDARSPYFLLLVAMPFAPHFFFLIASCS